jgi:Hydantoinase/oxoprolinase
MHDVALGFIDVANEAMCRPIRALTQARGLDVSQHVLACFGGAGGQHACAVARRLGMRTVFVHRYASILSAVGMGLASVVQEAQVGHRLSSSANMLGHIIISDGAAILRALQAGLRCTSFMGVLVDCLVSPPISLLDARLRRSQLRANCIRTIMATSRTAWMR